MQQKPFLIAVGGWRAGERWSSSLLDNKSGGEKKRQVSEKQLREWQAWHEGKGARLNQHGAADLALCYGLVFSALFWSALILFLL